MGGGCRGGNIKGTRCSTANRQMPTRNLPMAAGCRIWQPMDECRRIGRPGRKKECQTARPVLACPASHHSLPALVAVLQQHPTPIIIAIIIIIAAAAAAAINHQPSIHLARPTPRSSRSPHRLALAACTVPSAATRLVGLSAAAFAVPGDVASFADSRSRAFLVNLLGKPPPHEPTAALESRI
ncbi:hypothetical protein BM1_02312 [Bipolaris maydis]|nr:hypothetical protein BM1_02312 [Bipolaris maydis]